MLRYNAPPSTVEPTVYQGFNSFKRNDPNLFNQYMELARASGYDTNDMHTCPLPQDLPGWTDIFHLTREDVAQQALRALNESQGLLDSLEMRPFGESSQEHPFRSRSDNTFTLIAPALDPLGEEDVTFEPELQKLSVVSHSP